MIKKLTTVLFLAMLITGYQSASNIQNTWARDLSVSECPIKMAGEISAITDETKCNRQMTNDRRGYMYFNDTLWGDENNFVRLVYLPIKNYQHWTKPPKSEKKDIHQWDELKDVDLNKATAVSCTGYDCYTFKVPEDDAGHCLWFFKNAKQGDKFSDGSHATGILTGYTCSKNKEDFYNASEAMKFISNISTK